MSKPTVNIVNKATGASMSVHADPGASVSEIIKNSKLSFSMPCGGNHTCGKCKFAAIGSFSDITEKEKVFLSEEEINSNIRLACFTRVKGDCTIIIGNEEKASIAMETVESTQTADGKCSIAIDIGTTTVVGYIFQNKGMKLLASKGEMNAQRTFGADVISRIDYSNKISLKTLTQTIRDQLDSIIKSLLKTANVSADRIEQITVTGNTTMLHFFDGIEASEIAVYPFKPRSLFDVTNPCEKYFSFKNVPVYLPSCAAAYLGADIMCSVLASGMTEKERTSLIADIGTNGEMVLLHDGKLYACSTAAGPAFEGAGIEMGMPACDGAIDKCAVINEKIEFHTIGDKKAVGICATGLISAVSLMIENNIIDETGLILTDEHAFTEYIDDNGSETVFYIGDSGVKLTQKDIRQLQLAKSAVAAGISALIKECEITADDIDDFYICGGFGSYINPIEASKIGLFPVALKDKCRSIGNAAAKGASMLISDEQKEKLRKIVKDINVIELSMSEIFMQEYIEKMYFKAE